MASDTGPDIQADPRKVDAAWLTAVLRHSGHECEVAGFTAGNVGTGQVGQNVRFELQYAAGDGPRSIVGKFASDDPVSRQTGIALLNYLREVYFYQQLRPTLDIQTPRVLFADIEPESHDFVVMMEDLAPAEQGDQLAGCGAAEAKLALTELAGLQGPRWNDASLREIEWMSGNDSEDTGPAMILALWQQTLAGYLERYGDRLSEPEMQLTRALDEKFDRYVARRDVPYTVVHGDYRLDNMMFGGPYPLAVVDWQSPAVGPGLQDAGYFMGTGLDPEPRRACERDLLAHYHGILVERYGVTDFSFDECWDEYRRYSFAGLVMAVIASMIVGQTERGDDMFMAMARRSAHMALDLEAIHVL